MDRSSTRVGARLAASPRSLNRRFKRQPTQAALNAIFRMQKSGGSRNAAYVSSGGKSIKEMEDSFVRDSRSGRLVSEAEKRERQAFFAEVQRVKARIHSVAWSTVNPQGRFIARWDVVTAFALVFTALVTPFEVGFYNRGTDLYIGPINFTLNRIVDAIFLADIVIQFFLPFRLPSSQGGRMVYDTSVIRRHYLRGWFPYDVLTCFPFDLLVGGITAASGGSFDGLVGPNLLRVFKFLRFMKLMRVLRIGRIIHRWQDHVGVSLVFLSLMQVRWPVKCSRGVTEWRRRLMMPLSH